MTKNQPQRIAIVGSVGVPANYGGFETLVENLLIHHEETARIEKLTVYCSSKSYEMKPNSFLRADLRYIPLDANGVQSIPYDMWSMISAIFKGTDTILVLGVSGAIILPFVRLFTRTKIVTNIDGIEWKRDKWGALQRKFLKFSEALAVRFSHHVIADNGAIASYVREAYNKECSVIAYGGDHAILARSKPLTEIELPLKYAFNVCRIEPENNVHMMLEAFSLNMDCPIVCVGNWDRSDYGRDLKAKYANMPGIHILDPIYDAGKLKTLREGASLYVHGHSAGGTNPSLVEMMHFGIPVFAFDVSFNRFSTDNQAVFFKSSKDLREKIEMADVSILATNGFTMKHLANERYTWEFVGGAYFNLLNRAAQAV